ncbi:MAG: hypothetical protein AAFN74_08360 [Myxococcota bacterium]
MNARLLRIFTVLILLGGASACSGLIGDPLSVDGQEDGGQDGGRINPDVGLGEDSGVGIDVVVVDDAGSGDAGVPTEPPVALSTRSLTSDGRGSDPRRIVIDQGRLTVDLAPLEGATVYRATLDPFLDPRPQRATRRMIVDGVSMRLVPPRKLTFDATEAVRTALDQGLTSLIIDVENMELSTASLDVFCSLPAPVPVAQVTNLAVQHQQGDTMLTFEEGALAARAART